MGDVGGGDGADTFDGDYQPPVLLDAADVANGSLEDAVGDADAIALVELGGIFVVFDPFFAGGGDKHEGIHLVVGDDERNAAVFFAPGVKNDSVGKVLLNSEGISDAGTKEHQRVDDGLSHLFPVSTAYDDCFFTRNVCLDVVFT